jgi:hypothetical protein
MKLFKAIVFFIGILFLCGAVGLWAIISSETPKSFFKDYQEAKASGSMSRGWIPTFIPNSSVNIYEQHSVDSNWVEMTFDYSVDDINNTRLACDSELGIERGIEFKCEYFSSNVIIRLFNNGKAELYSSPQ